MILVKCLVLVLSQHTLKCCSSSLPATTQIPPKQTHQAQSVICQDVVEASVGTHRATWPFIELNASPYLCGGHQNCPKVDELLYSVALLGATHLQAHPLASVRQWLSNHALGTVH